MVFALEEYFVIFKYFKKQKMQRLKMDGKMQKSIILGKEFFFF